MAIDVRVPEVGESVSEGVIVRWLRQSGDVVKADEPLFELETDKATMEIVADSAGRLEILAPAGSTVRVGAVVGRIDATAISNGPPAAQAGRPTSDTENATAQAGRPTESPPLSPAVRKLVAEHEVDPTEATGQGDRPSKGDVLRHVHAREPAPAGDGGARPADAAAGEREETERRPMTQLRRRIAERLVEAQRTAAILTTFNEIDLAALLALRTRYRERFRDKHGVDLGLMSLFGLATIRALHAIAVVNARIDGVDIVYHRHVHLGIAVSTPRGLVVPVVRYADRMSLVELERAIGELARTAREGRISPDQLTDGTFTISNGGVFGSLLSTPILNPPQSGVLGMHKIERRPIAVDGQVVIRPMMYVALSYDHRLVDGEQAVTFLVRVKEQLEDPARIILDV